MKTSRRDFILKSMLATAGITTSLSSMANANEVVPNWKATPASSGIFSINIFSKNLHWLDYTAMAEAAASMGFDGIDLTVRPDGHVLPERVTEDLPKAVEAVKKAGLNVFMMTTAITKADDPLTEPILKTASALGISYYRMGWINYDEKKSIEDSLKDIQVQLSKLAALNKKYKIHAGYQNHQGTSFGAPIWDLAGAIKNLDPNYLGSQYDVLHANVEGANSWPLGLKLLRSHIRTMDIKDYRWAKKETGWKAEVVPLGEGMIDYKKYFKLVKEYNIQGPFSIHYEYPLGGAENGAKSITIPKEEVLAAMKKDVVTLKRMLAEAGIVN
ncbi:MAG TPA: sugar phosphate isomerase/epimerase family protein [Cyclobacteriaceae bacterium]